MQRILIIGPCGAGKSTLAFALGARLGLPIFHMDKLNWQTGWVESGDDAVREKLAAITATDRWIIEGTYGGTLSERLARATHVICLDYPISLCVTRLLRRIWTYRGRSRPDMTEGCPERFDLGFLLYTIRWNGAPRLRMEAKLKGFETKLVRLNNPAELALWIDSLPHTA